MSCNYLPLPRAVEMTKNSDTMSEISESGTTLSGWTSKWDSREDLRDLATKLGLKDVSDLYQERFRVDRRKLEQMLTGDNDALFPADVFFAKIMEDTDTSIIWPNKLKIGAKSKKDPHVRIAGRPEDVAAARERILTILDTRCNRVTMKMDVSYTDHSHIIGKGGLSIKRVMEETACHVHFPDSNRTNPNEKSNQVSISGDIDGVEIARARVRELVPLIFGFELPIMSKNVDPTCAYVMKIQDQYKVQVMFKTRPKLHATLVLVKGVEWESAQVKQATMLLMEYMCENLAGQISVQMSMEISPHHHQIVLAKDHSNLKAIMKYTNCQIMIPDAQDPNIPILKKSNVTITGTIHNVYKARQLLMGSLPLILIFDLPDDTTGLRVKPSQIQEVQASCEVNINIRQKANKTTKACVIKGIEKHAANIYKARNLILGIDDESPLEANIPDSYHFPTSVSLPSASVSNVLTPTNINPPPISPLLSPLFSPTWWQQPPGTPGSHPSPHFQTAHPSSSNHGHQSSNPPFVGLTQQSHFFFNMMQNMSQNNGVHTNGGHANGAPQTSYQGSHQQPQYNQQANHTGQNYMIGNQSGVYRSDGSSGYQSMPYYDQGHVDPTIRSGSSISSTSSLSTISSVNGNSPHKGFSPTHFKQNFNDSPFRNDLSNALTEMNIPGEYHGPTVDKRSPPNHILAGAYELENKRLAAMRAMQSKPSPNHCRVPNNSWSGYGISHTSPGGMLMDKFRTREEEIWKPNSPSFPSDTSQPPISTSSAIPSMNTSNILDHTPNYIWNKVSSANSSQWSDLPSMLTFMKLEHYISTFKKHEIDLTVFSTLTDQDLLEIGISAFGARRRILLAISELNKKNAPFCAAPGAERKNSSSSSSTGHGSPKQSWQ